MPEANDDLNLFRQAVVDSRARRLHGDVILKQSFATKFLAIFLVLVVVAAICWLLVGHYARVEQVQGVLVPIDGYAKIYAQRPGMVTKLLVKDGTRVRAGQKLAIIEIESPLADGTRTSQQALGSIDNQISLTQEQISLVGRRSDREDARLGGIIDGLERQLQTLVEQIELQEQIVASMTANQAQIKAVVDRGFISKLEFDRRQQSILAAREDLSRLRQQKASVEADRTRTINERGQIRLNSANDTANVRTALEGLRQQHGKAEGERDYAVIAPLSGRVTMIQTGEGRVVQGQMPLMAVIPDDAPLLVNLYVPSRAIGFIRQGAEVRLMYDAFPYQRFGTHVSHVDSVSRLAIAGQETDAPFKIDEPVYRVTARLDRQSISASGKDVRLQAGMTLVGNMILERQSFMAWLLEPLRSASGRN